MHSQQIAHLAFKLIGILAIIQAVRLLPDMLGLGAWGITDQFAVNVPLLVLAQVIPFTLLLSGGCLLIVKSMVFAGLTVGEDAEPDGTSTAADIHSILVSSVGLLLVGLAMAAVPAILHAFAVFYSEFGNQLPKEQYRKVTDSWIQLSGVILQLGIGLFLVFRSSTIVHLVRRRFDRSNVIAADGQCPHCGFWFESKNYQPGAAAYLCSNCKQEIPRERVAQASD
jgi:DNA-directed RNA polymerase subunit RPC12/RpoP